jgi:hypothetical protein
MNSRFLIPKQATMTSLGHAIAGGLVATFVVGAMLMIKNAIGAFPDVHIPQTLSVVIGMPGNLIAGGIAFAVIGMFLLSLVYAVISPRIPFQSKLTKGLIFGFALWLAVMLVVMPLAGAGMFALNRSAVVPAVHLVIMLVYALVLALMSAAGGGAGSTANSRQASPRS